MYYTKINISLFVVPYVVKPDTGGQQTVLLDSVQFSVYKDKYKGL